MADTTVNDTLGRLDLLQTKIKHLDAMLAMAYGEQGDSFRRLNDDLQDNFLWACSTIADECKTLACGLSAAELK